MREHDDLTRALSEPADVLLRAHPPMLIEAGDGIVKHDDGINQRRVLI